MLYVRQKKQPQTVRLSDLTAPHLFLDADNEPMIYIGRGHGVNAIDVNDGCMVDIDEDEYVVPCMGQLSNIRPIKLEQK